MSFETNEKNHYITLHDKKNLSHYKIPTKIGAI